MTEDEVKQKVDEAVKKAKEEAEQNVMRKLEGQGKLLKQGQVAIEQKRLDELEEKEKESQQKGLSDNEKIRSLQEERKKDKEKHQIEIGKLNEKIKQQSIETVARNALRELNPVDDADILAITKHKLDMRDGKVVVLDEHGEVEYDGGEPLSPKTFYTNLAKEKSNYFKSVEHIEKGTGLAKNVNTTTQQATNLNPMDKIASSIKETLK